VKIWVDLANSPQVLVLQPVIGELRRHGHHVVVTSRDFAQTIELADSIGLAHLPIGQHGGSGRLRKLAYNLERSLLLTRFAAGQRFDLAFSHNSYTQAVAARLLGIPYVAMMDYEHHRANHLAFRLARRVLVPHVFPEGALRMFGADHRAVRYPGLKEDLYLTDFRARPDFRREIGVPLDLTLVVLRPPAMWADYYHGKGQTFAAVVRLLRTTGDCFVVYLPRIREQAGLVSDLPADRVLMPEHALDGPNLLAHADLAISGGGTMIREAAVLGTPAYSIFEGRLGAVDARLAAEDRLRWIRRADEVTSIRVERKPTSVVRPAQPGLVSFVADAVAGTARRTG
jgi:predicted glycosyltransferase